VVSALRVVDRVYPFVLLPLLLLTPQHAIRAA